MLMPLKPGTHIPIHGLGPAAGNLLITAGSSVSSSYPFGTNFPQLWEGNTIGLREYLSCLLQASCNTPLLPYQLKPFTGCWWVWESSRCRS